MPIVNDTIGSESFIRLDGSVEFAQQQFSDQTRYAVDGVAFRDEGKRGIPFTLRAIRDTSSRTDAVSLLATYKGMVGDVVSITQTGVARSNYKILAVSELPDSRTVRTGIGGLVGGAYLLVTQWTFIHKATS